MLYLQETKNLNFYYNDIYYDYIFNYKNVGHNYFYNYKNISQFKKRSSDILVEHDNKLRCPVSEILREINLKYGCGSKTLDNIEKLKKSATLVVTGGQQPGFFTGPLFIIYKIISVIKLSQYLSGYLKVDVVPVFWNASDDSNFNSINSVYLAGHSENILKIQIPKDEAGISSTGKRYSDIYIDKDHILKKIKELGGFLQLTEFSNEVEKFLSGCLAETVGQRANSIKLTDYFSVIITKLFSRYGLVILDPSAPGLKKMALDWAHFDIENNEKIEKEITRSGLQLVKEGYHSQLVLQKNVMNFYIVTDGIRNRVHMEGRNNFSFGGTSITKTGLIDFLDSDPSSLSLNVVLRPLFQDTILPTLSTVCGPGEVSYFAQLKGIYEIASKKSPIIYPRFSATIIEKKVEKSFKKTGVDYELVNPDRKSLLEKTAGKIINFSIDELIINFEESITSSLSELKKSVEINGLQILNSFNRIESNIKKETGILKKKIISEINNKKTSSAGDISKILENIFPLESLQERIYCIFSYINKYSFNFIDDIFKITDIKNNCHKFIFFKEDDKKG